MTADQADSAARNARARCRNERYARIVSEREGRHDAAYTEALAEAAFNLEPEIVSLPRPGEWELRAARAAADRILSAIDPGLVGGRTMSQPGPAYFEHR